MPRCLLMLTQVAREGRQRFGAGRWTNCLRRQKEEATRYLVNREGERRKLTHVGATAPAPASFCKVLVVQMKKLKPSDLVKVLGPARFIKHAGITLNANSTCGWVRGHSTNNLNTT